MSMRHAEVYERALIFSFQVKKGVVNSIITSCVNVPRGVYDSPYNGDTFTVIGSIDKKLGEQRNNYLGVGNGQQTLERVAT